MIDPEILHKSLNLAAVVTILMGIGAVVLVKISDRKTKHKTSHKK